MQGHAHPPEKETPARRRRPPPCTQPREPSRASALRGLCRAPREWGPHHAPPKPRFPKRGLQVRPSAADLALPCVRGCGLRRQDGRRLCFSFRPGPARAQGYLLCVWRRDMDQKLSKLVEELTTSGEPRLNPEKMKELKKICKSSEEQLSRAYRLLIAQLTQEHAEIRLSAFQIVEELFVRSHQFRMLVVSNFQEFLELTLGTDPAQPLPPPREAAQRLRQATTRAVEGWNEKFGEAYKKLALGYHFLRHNKKVDFQDTNARSLAERKREEEKQKHLDKIYQERASQAEREMQEMSGEIESCLTEVESCFRLLVPFDFDPNPETESLGMASGMSDALRSSCAGQVGPCRSGTPDPRDGEQPCCSRDLPASAGHPRAGGGAQPSQTATGDPSDEDEDSDLEEFVRSHGLGSHKYTLDVELCSEGLKVQENEDNLALIHAARDTLKLIRNKFLPAVCSWIQRFTRVGTHGGCLKRAIDLKAELELVLRKYKELDIEPEGGERRRGVISSAAPVLAGTVSTRGETLGKPSDGQEDVLGSTQHSRALGLEVHSGHPELPQQCCLSGTSPFRNPSPEPQHP
eukprot:XP_016863986.1 UV-stimulated scaffold protein A isoform X4 [Homo sapiens]